MKIALINPRASFLSLNPEFNEFWSNSKYTSTYRQNWSGIGTGLLIIASLTPPKFEIELIDENIEDIDFSKNYDLVGITAMTQQAIRAYQIADEFRAKKIKVIIGGIHATVLPEEAMGHADSVVAGEAEYLWPELIKDFQNNELKPFYRNNRPVDLGDSPIPRYDLIKNKKYSVCWVQTSRGCPHHCEFCAASNVYGNEIRYKRMEQVIKEILAIKKQCGTIRISFSDDNLLLKKNRAKIFLQNIKNLNLRWAAQTDITVAEDADLLYMFLFLGFESLSEEGMKIAGKRKAFKLNEYPEYIKRIQHYGIGIMGSFITGLDSDDKYVYDKILKFSIENNLYDVQVAILTPLPGTKVREILMKQNRLLSTTWETYTIFDVNIKHPKLSEKEMAQGVLHVFKEFNSEQNYKHRIQFYKDKQKDLLLNGMK